MTMRIIAGKHRRRKLFGPADEKTTRPITDRVKTSLFDRLSAARQLEDSVMLDMFSGTGSMGIECLSRGAKHVLFLERDREAIKQLKKNLEMIDQTHDATILSVDALSPSLSSIIGRSDLSLITCDPPYQMMYDQSTSDQICQQMTALKSVCIDDAVLIIRTPAKVKLLAIEQWGEPMSLSYGSMALHYYGI